MKSMAFLAQADHNRKAAIYAAEHDGKLRNFAYTEELGECRETFSRLLHAVQEGEIGVILTPEAACLAIETSPRWMEAFIQAVKEHEVLIGDHSHGLVYDLREERAPPARRRHRAESLRGRLHRAGRELVPRHPLRGQGRWRSDLRTFQRGKRARRRHVRAGTVERDPGYPGTLRDKRGERLVPSSPGTQGLALPYAAARGRDGRASRCRDGAASGFPAPRRARESDLARERAGAEQAKPETEREKAMSEQIDFTREEYELTKVALERSDVPAEALALLSAWIEGERLQVDDREDAGGINFCRMDARVIAPLPHIVASFFARRPYKRKAGHYPNWNGFYLLLYRDVEEGWKLVQVRRDTSYAQFVPLFAARIKAVEEINKLRGKE